MLNEAIGRYNRGQHDFGDRLFKLYQWLLQNGLLLHQEQLSPTHYKNILTLAVQLQKLDWGYRFLSDYRSLLPPSTQQPAYTYNLAVLKHADTSSHEALKLLQAATVDEPFYHLGARTLQSKIYYEDRAFEALFSALDAYEAYLRRKKSLGKEQLARHKNFIKALRKITKLKLRSLVRNLPENTWGKLLYKIAQEPHIAQREWLQKTIAQASTAS